MTRLPLLLAAIAVAAPAAAQSQPQSSAPDLDTKPPAKVQSLLENCDAHKFETFVDATVDGKPHRSKVKLCGKEGQSDAEWIGTLKDAIAKLDANTEMEAPVRDQIVTAIRAEIARLQSGGTELARGEPVLVPRGLKTSSAPLSDDYTMLPPLPTKPTAPTSVLGSATAGIAGAKAKGGVALPLIATGPKPKLDFTCIGADFPGGGPCVTLNRDTIVTVRSGEAVAEPVSLRFIRGGSEHGEIDLGALRKGQTVRFTLPQQVCSGVVTSEVEVAVMRSGQFTGREGPYLLHC
jgi:hypothetical protein